MPYFHVILWDGINDDHVAEHGISVEEFEEVVLSVRRPQSSNSSGRPMVIGTTSTGKNIACV